MEHDVHKREKFDEVDLCGSQCPNMLALFLGRQQALECGPWDLGNKNDSTLLSLNYSELCTRQSYASSIIVNIYHGGMLAIHDVLI